MKTHEFLLISNMYPTPDNPGFGSFVKNVCEGMEPYGIRMKDIAVIRGRGTGIISKLKKYLGFYTSICLNFFKRHDFVYIHFPNQAVPLLNILYLFHRPTTVVNYHGEDLMYDKKGPNKWLGKLTERFCRRHAARIIVPSSYFKEIVVNRGIADADQVIVSPSGGINPELFHPASSREFLKEGILHLGCVGRLEPGKGALEFASTCRLLSKRGINYKASIIGYGSLKGEIKKYIADNNLADNINLIEGISQKDLGNHYREFDLLVFLSSRDAESLGLTGIEAMACGTPVIGSNAGGIRSYLLDGENGFIVHSITPEETVAAISRFTALTEDKRQEMSRRCIHTGNRYFTEEVCHNLAEELKSTVGE